MSIGARATMSLVFLKYNKLWTFVYNIYIVYFPHTAQCIFQIRSLVGGSTRLEGPLQPLLYCWLLKYCDVCIDDWFCSDLSCFCAINNEWLILRQKDLHFSNKQNNMELTACTVYWSWSEAWREASSTRNCVGSSTSLLVLVVDRVAGVGKLSASAKNAFNSFVGRVFANSRQKTLFFRVLPKFQQQGSFYLVLPSFYLVLLSFYLVLPSFY